MIYLPGTAQVGLNSSHVACGTSVFLYPPTQAGAQSLAFAHSISEP